jgi:hypothetical protein
MCGAISPLLQYAFMAWCSVKSTGTTLPSPFEFHLTLKGRNVPFLRNVSYLGLIFYKNITQGMH